MNNTKQLLIIGTGNVVGGYDSPLSSEVLTHIHAILNIFDSPALTVVDPSYKSAQKFFSKWRINCDYYEKVQDLPPKKNFDFVLVACPTVHHYSCLRYLLKHVNIKSIICEKPCTMNFSQIKEIAFLAESMNIPIYVNYQRRLEPFWKDVHQNFNIGHYGALQSVTVKYSKGLINYASHAINLLQYILGDLSYISTSNFIVDYSEHDKSYTFTLSADSPPPNPLIFFIPCDNRLFTIFEIDIIFSKFRIFYDDSTRTASTYSVDTDPFYPSYYSLVQSSKIYAFTEPFLTLWELLYSNSLTLLEPLLIKHAVSTYHIIDSVL